MLILLLDIKTKKKYNYPLLFYATTETLNTKIITIIITININKYNEI